MLPYTPPLFVHNFIMIISENPTRNLIHLTFLYNCLLLCPNPVTSYCKCSESIREKMKKNYMSNPNFNYEMVNRASLACGPMVKWAIAQVRKPPPADLYTGNGLRVNLKSFLDSLHPLSSSPSQNSLEENVIEEDSWIFQCIWRGKI